MMKSVYIFDNKDYFHALQFQVGSGFAVYGGIRQRGGGLGGVLGALVKYGIPIAKQYIWPHAKNAFIRTASDIVTDRASLKESLKSNSGNFVKDVGNSIATKLIQAGSGLSRKRKSFNYSDFSAVNIKKRKSNTTQKPAQRKRKQKNLKKTDFISTCL